MKMLKHNPLNQFVATALIVLTLLTIALTAPVFANQKQISASEFLDIPKAERLLVDVRTPEEYNDGFIPSAINLPLADLPEEFQKLGNKNQQIVVYCRSGKRAAKAITFLTEQGFTNILHLEGDYLEWSASERSVSKP